MAIINTAYIGLNHGRSHKKGQSRSNIPGRCKAERPMVRASLPLQDGKGFAEKHLLSVN
jgi:hypothetical protein